MINVVQNFLDQPVLDTILQKYEDSKGKPLFEINEMGRWGSDLYNGNFGPVYVLPMFTELCEYLNPKLAAMAGFEEYYMTACFLHSWQHGSGINWHMDSVSDKTRIGLTVYLNQQWSVNWGGLFLWEKDGNTGWYNPQYNSAVWFESPLWHSVSIISRAAAYPRLSLQVFLEKRA